MLLRGKRIERKVWSGTWAPVSHAIPGFIVVCKLSSHDQGFDFYESISSQKAIVLKDYILKAIIMVGSTLGIKHRTFFT